MVAAMAKPLKPPRFRGSDFAMRYEQGRWSEDRIIAAINESSTYRALPYGRSAIGPANPKELEEYWTEYVKAESVGKRPDILVLRRDQFEVLEQNLRDTPDPTVATDAELADVLSVAVCGIEAENSLWVAGKMPDYGTLTITRSKFVAPTIIVKKEDVENLLGWQEHYSIPICVVQVFFDRAYIIALDEILEGIARLGTIAPSGDERVDRRALLKLQKELGIFVRTQSFADSRTGSTTKKTLYVAHYGIASLFGILDQKDPPRMRSGVVEEANGKIIPYVGQSNYEMEQSSMRPRGELKGTRVYRVSRYAR